MASLDNSDGSPKNGTAESGAMTDWQPIATAPISGDPFTEPQDYVLLWNGQHVGVGAIHSEEYAEEVGSRYWDEGGQSIMPEPTHWMPLPAPPSSPIEPDK